MSAVVRVGDRVTASYRVAPFLAGEPLEVLNVVNVGTKRKPLYRAWVAATERWAQGWLDVDILEIQP